MYMSNNIPIHLLGAGHNIPIHLLGAGHNIPIQYLPYLYQLNLWLLFFF
jgi:hypothetical protein